EDELKKTTQAVNYFSNCHYVRLLVKSDDGSKACMVMEVAGDGSAKTLADFFRSCSDNTQIEEILDRLFTFTLRTDSLNVHQTPKNAFACHTLKNEKQFHKNLLSLRPRAVVLLDWWQKAGAADRSKSLEAFRHGDLHGKNILVAQTGNGLEPLIIDFGRTGQQHVFYDLARLER